MTRKSTEAYTYPINLWCATLACECIFPSCGIIPYKWYPTPHSQTIIWQLTAEETWLCFPEGQSIMYPITQWKIKENENLPVNWCPASYVWLFLFSSEKEESMSVYLIPETLFVLTISSCIVSCMMSSFPVNCSRRISPNLHTKLIL